MRVLGIDPGIQRCGWAVVEGQAKFTAIAFDCLFTVKEEVMGRRLEIIFDQISLLFKKYQPQVAVMEDLFFNTNAKTAIIVGQARGVIMLAAQKANIPLISYPPLEIKMAITGYGRAEKEQIQKMVKSILKLETIPKQDDTADALAVALTHCFVGKFKSKISS